MSQARYWWRPSFGHGGQDANFRYNAQINRIFADIADARHKEIAAECAADEAEFEAEEPTAGR